MKKRRIISAAIAAASLSFGSLLTGCMNDTSKNGSAAPGGDVSTKAALESSVIENIAKNVIVASYQNLRDETRRLADQARALKTNPSQQQLELTQSQWRAARIPWESTEGFLFGPVDSLGVDPAIDSWPLSKLDLDTILTTRPNIDANFVRQLGTDVQGFHTAEYLVFGDGAKDGIKSIQEMTPAQLQYLVAVTEVLAEQTQKLFDSWTIRHDPTDANSKPYFELVSQPGLNNEFYASRSAVLQEYAQGMIKIAVEVGKGKISDPLGGDIGSADPTLVESQFSWNSLADFQNNVRSIQNLYTGDTKSHQGPGLDELVKVQNPELDKKVLDQIMTAERSIAEIAGPAKVPFRKAILDEAGRQRILKSIEALAQLEATLQNELLPIFQ